ncbi:MULTISPECIES: hypothetical protein [Cyanophyceae]|uniref:hypothetical protein n=1 Tax=Cyanophyceae TaxID=3028117 RepID=UPI0016859EBA|nr:hypothetical protein [Trichocoleus sp. FACHB-40]MBD2005597.1 hypothetical protein [Trichocoleus sp. FACHB-40]
MEGKRDRTLSTQVLQKLWCDRIIGALTFPLSGGKHPLHPHSGFRSSPLQQGC